MLKEYLKQKIVVFTCITLIFLFIYLSTAGKLVEQHKYLVTSYLFLGLMHFILGFIYQYKKTSSNKIDLVKTLLVWGASLVVTFLIIFILYVNGANRLLFIAFVILLFLIHGALNEQSLLERFGLKRLGVYWYTTPLFVYLFALESLKDKALFLGPVGLPANTFSGDALWYRSLVIGTFLAILFISIKNLTIESSRKIGTLYILIIASITFLYIYFLPPPSFVFLLAFLLNYHFVTWHIYYLFLLREKGKDEFSVFMTLSQVLALLFGVIIYYTFYATKSYQYLNATYLLLIFHTLNLLHLFTSLFNEKGVKLAVDKLIGQNR